MLGVSTAARNKSEPAGLTLVAGSKVLTLQGAGAHSQEFQALDQWLDKTRSLHPPRNCQTGAGSPRSVHPTWLFKNMRFVCTVFL